MLPVIGIVSALGACGAATGARSHGSTQTPTPTAAVSTAGSAAPQTSAPTSAATAAAAGDPLGLTGEGALKTVWTSQHQLDMTKSGGDAYLPRLANGGDTWAVVSFARGPGNRLTGFDYQVDPVISAYAMKGYLRQQLPSDAVVLGDSVNGGSLAARQCEITVYQSALLAQAFAAPDIGDPQGYVETVLSSSGTSDSSYDANQIDGASLLLSSGPSDLSSSC